MIRSFPNGAHTCLVCEGIHSRPCGASIAPRKSYTISAEDGEITYMVDIYSRAAIESVFGPLADADARHDAVDALERMTPRYGGPGRTFVHAASIRVGRRNVKIVQYCGLDI